MSVVVSIPYYGCKPYVRQAVDSILAQTNKDFALIVTNDGDPDPPWDVLSDIEDPRLIRFDSDVNRGRYFVDNVVLHASDAEFLLIQDADDWSADTRLETLLRHHDGTTRASVTSRIIDTVTWHATGGIGGPIDSTFCHRYYHVGLHRASVLRVLGGYDSGFRSSFDSLLMNLLDMVGSVYEEPEPLYFRRVRPDSLTHSKATGFGSDVRERNLYVFGCLYSKAWELYQQQMPADDLIAAFRDLLKPFRVNEEAAQPEIERLRQMLRDGSQV